VYWFFLRRETFFQLNRFYLLAMVLFSVLFPLLPIRWAPLDSSPSFVILLEPVMITPARVEQTLQQNLQWVEAASVAYLTGVVIFLLRFVIQLIQLHRITRRFGVKGREGEQIIMVDHHYSPFSFFNMIFISETIPPATLPTILAHERIHVRQHHTVDMLLIETATIFQWFNPVIWLAGREIKSIHEYLADEGVLQNGTTRSQYQQMILNETMGIQVNNLTNNFNVSLLKKRIAMMTKTKSKTWAKSKVLIALPALLVLLFMLTARSYSNADVLNTPDSPAFNQIHVNPIAEPVIQEKQKKETQIKYVAPVAPANEVYTVVEKQPSYPGGTDGYRDFLLANIKYPEEAVKKGVTGTVYVTFVVQKDGSIANVKVLRGIGTGCDEEAVRVVRLMPKWNPGEQKGKPVDVQYNLPIKFILDCNKKDEPKK
jgi:TonB family protein